MSETTGKYIYDWPMASLTADVLAVTLEKQPRVLLIRRGNPPFAGMYALPGGFVDPEECALDAARRELLEETGIEAGELVEFTTLEQPGRDPRGRTVTVVYLTVMKEVPPTAGDDAEEAGWFPLHALPPLAFDHQLAMDLLRERLTGAPSALDAMLARLLAAQLG